jgi:hypothetical protein
MPEKLSELRLYPDAPDLTTVGEGAHGYEPRFALWSNGGVKQRFVAVPSGSTQPPDPNDLSEGTVFFKTFSFEVAGEPEHRPIETRAMRLGDGGWEYYRYLWNEAAGDAVLLTTRTSEPTLGRRLRGTRPSKPHVPGLPGRSHRVRQRSALALDRCPRFQGALLDWRRRRQRG